MKKLMVLCLLVLQGFMLQAFAKNILASNTNLCVNDEFGSERIKLMKDFTFEVWTNDVFNYRGTWDFDDDECSAIILTYETEDEEGENTSIEMYLRVVRPENYDPNARGLQDRAGNKFRSVSRVKFQDTEYSKSNCE